MPDPEEMPRRTEGPPTIALQGLIQTTEKYGQNVQSIRLPGVVRDSDLVTVLNSPRHGRSRILRDIARHVPAMPDLGRCTV